MDKIIKEQVEYALKRLDRLVDGLRWVSDGAHAEADSIRKLLRYALTEKEFPEHGDD